MKRRILIADDEEIERRALRLILENEPDLEFVEAGNGIEALESVARDQPAVAILDIKMPGLDGIAVAERLRADHPELAIIFLTAYDQFDYARSAVRLQVDDFLLKPAATAEVIATIRRVLSRIANRENEQLSNQTAQVRLDGAIKLVAERLRHDLAEGLPDPEQIRKFLDLRGMAGGLRVMIEFRTAQPCPRLVQTVPLAESVLSDGCCLALAELWAQSGRAMLLGAGFPDSQAVSALAQAFRERARADLGINLLVGAAIAAGEGVQAGTLVNAAHRAATIASTNSPVLAVTVEHDSAETQGKGSPVKDTGFPALVSRALRIMESRQAEELSLNEVASQVGISPSHLSRQLARSTGSGFADCLAQFRIASAKEFLGNGMHSVKEVAHLVGFHDPAYFARVFRRFEGCSPAEYRNQTERPEAQP